MTKLPTSELLFNTSIESGLRSLFVLEAVHPRTCDLQRLVIYDYLLVHSKDVDGPESLHPATPLRSGELLVRRNLVGHGLQMMIRKGLVRKEFTPEGILYTATPYAQPVLLYFRSTYAKRCREISVWIARHFQSLSDDKLREYIRDNLGRWGAEFTRESWLWEEVE